MSDKPDPKFAKEAANLSLREKLLSQKKKGDRITASEIAIATGFADWRAFGAVIRTWARRSGLDLRPVLNDGWRIALDNEAIDGVRSLGDSARRKDERGLKLAMSVDATKLSEAEVRKLEHLRSRVANRVAQHRHDHEETKREFKLSDRVPLRAIGGAK